MSSLSWIPSAKSPETIDIRDEGDPGYEGLKDAETGKLVLDENGAFKDPPRLERPPWPEGHFVTIKAHVTSGDQAKAKRMSWLDEEGGEVEDASMRYRFWDADLVTCAVMIVGVKGAPIPDPEHEGEWLTPVDESGTPLAAGFFTDPDTGEAISFAGTDLDRLIAAKRLPGAITTFVDGYIEEKLKDPLGMRAAANGSSAATMPTSIPSSNTLTSSGTTGDEAAPRSSTRRQKR